MRIIGGKFKGTRFKMQGNVKARPTTDYAKEGLFNILNNKIDLEDLEVLDLFSGIGSISLEFISRGSNKTWAVEKERKNVRFIYSMIEKLDLKDIFKIVNADVFRFLKTCDHQFDLVFADPPYFLDKMNKVPQAIFESGVLKKGGLVIVEHDKKTSFNDHPNYTETREYGNVHFSFFE